ncbi:MAG: 3D domain-containing protein, partial [Eudoraea sp.]|nr:3D domain-containing protein [Eudoraea sp.]
MRSFFYNCELNFICNLQKPVVSKVMLTVGFIILIIGYSCKPKAEEVLWKSLQVTASAFNSVPGQTDANPSIAAWGDTLSPGMKCIAVSRDLIGKGLHHNAKIKIEGFEGIFLVKDKMHFRWRNRIDIYMGTDVA